MQIIHRCGASDEYSFKAPLSFTQYMIFGSVRLDNPQFETISRFAIAGCVSKIDKVC